MISKYTKELKLTEERVRECERKKNGHIQTLMRCLMIGEMEGVDEKRKKARRKVVAKVLLSTNQTGANLDVNAKDHKKQNPKSESD